MGLFGSNTETTRSTAVPWAPARAPLRYGMQQARQLYNQGAGFHNPQFQTFAPMSGSTQQALGSIWANAQGGNPLAGMSEGAISGILGGATNDKYNDLYASADNPHYAQAVQGQADEIGDDVARYYSGSGRFGSDASNAGMAKAIGNFREQALSNQWNQNIANQRGILGDQTQGQLNAVAAAPGAYDQRFLPGRAMGQVGAAYDDLAARQLQARLNRFNTRDTAGLNRLGAYNTNIAGGAGAGRSTTSTVQQPSNWLGGALGGALGGGSLLGVPGAVGGGILGLLANL